MQSSQLASLLQRTELFTPEQVEGLLPSVAAAGVLTFCSPPLHMCRATA